MKKERKKYIYIYIYILESYANIKSYSEILTYLTGSCLEMCI